MFTSKTTFLRLGAALVMVVGAVLPARGADRSEVTSNAMRPEIVVIGDSLGAGFQNYSLYDSGSGGPDVPPGGQKHGFANVIAEQAGTTLNLPLISYPGIPPVLTYENGVISRGTTVGSREPQTLPVQTFDLSVPGYSVLDAILREVDLPAVQANPSANGTDLLALEILGLPSLAKPSQACGVYARGDGHVLLSPVVCAVQLHPSIVIVDLGNNDALGAILDGIQPTNVRVFQLAYGTLMGALRGSGAKIVLANIPDVSKIPILYSTAQFEALCGVPPAGAGPNDYVVPSVVDLNVSTFNLCTNYAVRSAALVEETRQAVTTFNQIIAGEALRYHATLVDINGLFAEIAQNGYAITGKPTLTTGYLCGIFSLDGVHPSNTGYAIMANAFINAMNNSLNTGIPTADVAAVAATDALVPAVQLPACLLPAVQ